MARKNAGERLTFKHTKLVKGDKVTYHKKSGIITFEKEDGRKIDTRVRLSSDLSETGFIFSIKLILITNALILIRLYGTNSTEYHFEFKDS